MPRLSIIVPFRGNADALEKTLVSVLSNRPADSEVILSHDGSYTDPYSISDEVIFVETPRASQGRPRPSMVRLINEAILAATAPVIHVLADGCIVSEGWADSPVEVFQDQNVGAVAAILCDTKSAEPHSVGLRCQGMPQSVELAGVRSAARERLRIDGPTMNAGFFRRRVLLALNGFLEAAEQNADVDFALAIRDLELRCVADWNCKIACSSEMLLEPSGYGHGQ